MMCDQRYNISPKFKNMPISLFTSTVCHRVYEIIIIIIIINVIYMAQIRRMQQMRQRLHVVCLSIRL